MKTVLISVKKFKPSSAISRSPTPVDFVPPNGSCASPPTVGSLTCTMPVSTSSMNFMTDVMFDVKMEVVKPYSTLLANLSASSSDDAVATDSTGPKISSLKMRIDGETPSKIVGSTKKPLLNAS